MKSSLDPDRSAGLTASPPRNTRHTVPFRLHPHIALVSCLRGRPDRTEDEPRPAIPAKLRRSDGVLREGTRPDLRVSTVLGLIVAVVDASSLRLLGVPQQIRASKSGCGRGGYAATKRHPNDGVLMPLERGVMPGHAGVSVGGAAGNRTPDLLIANETRYQLRHSPLSLDRLRRLPPWPGLAPTDQASA